MNFSMKGSLLWIRRIVVLMVMGGTISSCVDIQGPVPPTVTSQDAFAELRFTTDAMLIAQGQTLQLSLRALASDGSPIPVDFQNVTWSLSDSVRLHVDTLGRITGNATSSVPYRVGARYTHGLTTRTATLQVYVTKEGERSASSLKLVLLDSARVGPMIAALPLPRIRIDLYEGTSAVRTGIQLPVTIPVPFYVSYAPTGGPNGEPVYAVSNGGSFLGTAWAKASVNLYGNEVMDSVAVTGTYPVELGNGIFLLEETEGTLTMGAGWDGVTPRVAPCAVLRVLVYTLRAIDIVFSDSTASPEGCASFPETMLQQIVFGWGAGFDQRNLIGGNVLNIGPGYMVGLRRSATRGEVSWYVRDAVTKQRLPYTGRYINVNAENIQEE